MSFLKFLLVTLLLFSAGAAPAQTTTNPNWKKIGPSYAIDMNSISRPMYSGDTAKVIVCIVMNGNCQISNLIHWHFDCRGHYRALDDSGKGMVDVPSNSVPGQVADIACAIAQTPSSNSVVDAETAKRFYESRYFLAGLLLRAGYVCDNEPKSLITTAFKLLDTNELKKITEAYPKTTEQWMQQGANNFNSVTMKEGIASACALAAKTRIQAADITKFD
jgi:hypothetical protein